MTDGDILIITTWIACFAFGAMCQWLGTTLLDLRDAAPEAVAPAGDGPPVPKNDIEALKMLAQAQEILFSVGTRTYRGFVDFPATERFNKDAVRIAFMDAKLDLAGESIEEVREVLAGEKIVSIADREARSAAMDLASRAARLEKLPPPPGRENASPRPPIRDEPTHH